MVGTENHVGEQAAVENRSSQRINAMLLASSTSSWLRLEVIKTWMAECAHTHGHCHWGYQCLDTTQLPRRLVDVSIPSHPWLALRSCYARQNVRYATLSHRWGDTSMLKLLRRNKKLFRRGIDLGTLPKVFQEAMEVCHFLDIKYIWIDALCLVQDDKLDCAREIAKMGGIFRNAYCNLSATSAAKAHDGLFVEGDPLHMSAYPICIERRDYSENLYVFSENSIRQLAHEPLLKRGWVFQERLLSPRTIYFGDQLHWECTELLANELLPSGKRVQQRDTLETICGNGTHFKLDLLLNIDEELSGAIYIRWHSLVQKYATCDLTFESDTLPAISGVARAFNERLKDKYLAGIWLRDVLAGLLWFVCHFRPSKSNSVAPQEKYRAPSWSWASRKGKIMYAYNGAGNALVTLIDAATIPAEKDEMGELLDGHLTFAGHLCPRMTRTATTDLAEMEGSMSKRNKYDCDNDAYHGTPLTEEYLLPLALAQPDPYREIAMRPHTAPDEIRGFIIRPVLGKPRVYTRVGMFEYPWGEHCTDEDHILYPEFLDFDLNAKREVITIV